MNLLRQLKYIITGKISHWNKTHNAVIKEIWSKLDNLEIPYCFIFRHFTLTTSFVIANLMGMSGPKQSIYIESKKVDFNTFKQLYTVMLCYFSFRFIISNRFSKIDFQNALIEVTNEPNTIHSVFQKLAKFYSKSKNELNEGAVAGEIWNYIVKLTKFDENAPGNELSYFMFVSQIAYGTAVKNIDKEFFVETKEKKDSEISTTSESVEIPGLKEAEEFLGIQPKVKDINIKK